MWKWLNPLDDFWRKLLAAGLALFLCWNIYERNASPDYGRHFDFKNVRIDYNYESLDKKRFWIDEADLPKSCEVKFSSPIDYVEKDAKIVYVFSDSDFDKIEDGHISIQFKEDNLLLRKVGRRSLSPASDPDSAVSEFGFSPNPFKIKADLIVRKEGVPIEPVFIQDDIPDGFRFAGCAVDASVSLSVSGPARFVDSISSVQTKPIDLKGKTEKFTISSPLVIDAVRFPQCSLSPRAVDVSVEIEALKPKTFTYDLFVIQSSGRTGTLKIAGSLPQVKLTVSDDSQSASRDWFYPYIDISDFSEPGTYNVDVHYFCRPGKDARVHECSLKTVSVTLDLVGK